LSDQELLNQTKSALPAERQKQIPININWSFPS